MARSSGGFSDGLLVAVRAFIAGCSGCLGVGAAMVTVVVLTTVVFQAQFVALVRTITIPFFPNLFPVLPAPTVCVTPVSEVVTIEVFVTQENNPLAAHITQVKIPVQQPLFVCVRPTKPASVRFTVQITLPNGQVIPFGSEFVTDPSGKAICLGMLTDMPTTPGVIRIDALAGATIIGSTMLTVVN